MQLLWREPWLKPLIDYDLDSETCDFCKAKFEDLVFVTSCEFCNISIMHDKCANSHIIENHISELKKKFFTIKTSHYMTFSKYFIFLEKSIYIQKFFINKRLVLQIQRS